VFARTKQDFFQSRISIPQLRQASSRQTDRRTAHQELLAECFDGTARHRLLYSFNKKTCNLLQGIAEILDAILMSVSLRIVEY
jgi:hypothetical protein